MPVEKEGRAEFGPARLLVGEEIEGRMFGVIKKRMTWLNGEVGIYAAQEGYIH